MNHLSEEQLNDLAEDAPDAAANAHLALCAACRAELEQVRRLVADVRALPSAVAPGRDLLAGIHERIAGERAAAPVLPAESGRPEWRGRTLWSARWPLAAAAILLIVATAVLTRALSERAGGPAGEAVRTSSTSVLVGQQTRALALKYESAIAELEQLIQAQRSNLAPVTLQLLEQNLQVIDRAIRESRAALEQDPNSELINEWLRSAYERKLDLLRRATTFAAT